ncbi:MAG: hypothetical protein HY011_20705 [Acidobacteria bacterium]|nr:hypothetical protein [Acidobacteriota bacterium]
MQFIKEFIWLLVGIGLTLIVTSDNHMVRQVGIVLFLISLLWRLLIYLRESQPSLERINAIGEPKLSIIEALATEQPAPQLAAPVPINAISPVQQGRTPVQKLIDEEPPN